MRASIAISGVDVNADVVYSSTQAQVAYWPINNNPIPIVTSTTPNNLTQPVSAIEMTQNYAPRLDQILINYNNIDLIQDWTINLDPIRISDYNPIANYAAANGIMDPHHFFNDGDQVVAMMPFTYEVLVNDYMDNSVVIIPTTNVFGVVTQVRM